MPSVSFDGQSLSIRGRRIWLSAVEFEYSLLPRAAWRQRLTAVADAGFNAVVCRVPWSLHEPRSGHFVFDGDLAIAEWLSLVEDIGLHAVLRVGPSVGGTFDGGGLPAWLSDIPGIRMREAHPAFLERVSKWFRAVAAQVVPHQATERSKVPGRDVGSIVAIGIEDDWACDSASQSSAYLGELVRFAREVEFEVPILTANNSWTSIESAIDVWTGWDEPTATARQLGALRPAHPRLLTLRSPDAYERLGVAATPLDATLLGGAARKLGEALAGGAQFALADGVATTHHGLTQGCDDRGVFATTAHPGFVVTNDGRMRPESAAIRRLAHFASSFGHVLAQASAGPSAVLVDPSRAEGVAVAALTGGGGTAVLAFASPRAKPGAVVPLLLGDGRRLDAHLGEGHVSTFLLDADLLGSGRLDYSTISPVAFVDRRFLVFVGPPGTEAELSIDGVPVTLDVPRRGATTPTVERVHGLVLVVCTSAQFASMRRRNGELVFEDETRTARSTARRVLPDGSRGTIQVEAPPASGPRREVRGWTTVPASEFVDGTSSRFATIDGPASLTACGVREHAAWYRVTFRRAGAGTMRLHAPGLGDRITLWLDGQPMGTFGRGPGAAPFPATLKVGAGEHRLVGLVERCGRPVAGDHLGRPVGLFGPLFEVAPLSVTPKANSGVYVDRFAMSKFVYRASEGESGAGEDLAWTLPSKRKGAVLVDAPRLRVAGMLLADGAPVARASADGTRDGAVLVESARKIQFVFDDAPEEAARKAVTSAVRLYDVVRTVGTTFAMARWMPPTAWSGDAARREAKMPSWSRGTVALAGDHGDRWLELGSAVDGVAFVNGHCVGRYVRRSGSGANGAARLPVPRSWVRAGENEVMLFDLAGGEPRGVGL